MGDSQDILFIGDLSVCIPFTSSSLMVSNFALCGIPFLAGFYSRDFILEMFSIRYINIFGFLLLFVSTGLTVCYSFRLFHIGRSRCREEYKIKVEARSELIQLRIRASSRIL